MKRILFGCIEQIIEFDSAEKRKSFIDQTEDVKVIESFGQDGKYNLHVKRPYNKNKRLKGVMYMEDVLYTVSEVAKLIKCNTNYTYSLINNGLLPALKLGSMKVRKSALLEFLEKYEGKDLTDINNVSDLEIGA